jgi:hypothetical protein
MSERSIYLRDQAAKCERHANNMDDSETKVRLRKLTAEYLVEASDIESKESGGPCAPPFSSGPRNTTGPETADNRTISQLEAEGYPWIGCECCKGTVGVPFKMLRERIPMLSAMTLDQLGAKRCGKCGKRPERYYPANQKATPGSFEAFRCPGPAPSTIPFPRPAVDARAHHARSHLVLISASLNVPSATTFPR